MVSSYALPHRAPTLRRPVLAPVVESPDNLCAALRRAALTDRGITLVTADDADETRSYARILEGAERRARALLASGVRRGDSVVLVLDTSFELVETFFAIQLAGATPVPAYPPVAMARLDGYLDLLGHVIDVTRARFVVTDARIARVLGTLRRRATMRDILDVADLDEETAHGWPIEELSEPDPNDPGFVQCTSGSTSAPKPVLLLQRNLVANLRGFLARFTESDGSDVLVSWLPLYHDLGLIGMLLGAVYGTHRLVLMSPSTFLLDPGAWWRAASRHRATVTAAPCFAFGLSTRRIDDADVASLDLSRIRTIVSGAEPIQPAIIDAFFAKLAPAGLGRESFCAAYGLAESCVGVTGAEPGEGLRIETVDRAGLQAPEAPRALPSSGADAVQCVALGRPFTGTTIVIRGADGEELPERRVGEVCVRGGSVMAGYLGHPDATADALRGGELRTGDLGYLAGGELFLVGRAKHMLIVRGRNYYAEAIEAVAEAVDGVRKGNAIAFGVYDDRRGHDQLYVVVESRAHDDAERAALELAVHTAVSEEIGLAPHRVIVTGPNTLPKTSSGKRQRNRCRELVLAGELPKQRRRRTPSGVFSLVRSQIAHAEHGVARLFSRAS